MKWCCNYNRVALKEVAMINGTTKQTLIITKHECDCAY